MEDRVREGHFKSCPDPTDCWCKVRRISYVLYIAGVIIAIQIFTGWMSGSLALYSDAGHTATDTAAAIIALVAAIFVRFGTSPQKADNRAFTLNILLLFCAATLIAHEAFGRLFGEERAVVSWLMMLGGAIGGIGNFIQHRILDGAAEEHKDHAHGALSFHYLTDIVISGGVVVAGILIYITGYTAIDPIISLCIAIWIVWGTIHLVRSRVA